MFDASFKTDPEIQKVMERCYIDTEYYARTMLPEIFYSPFSTLHHQIVDMLDSDAPRIAIAAPRGFGKTSTVVHAFAGRKLLFQDCNFFVYVSNSATNAELQTENLKFELTTNINLRKLFGPVKAKKGKIDGVDETFSKKAWATAGGTLVLPRGSGQQVRGLLYHSKRPDLIVIDDLEDSEEVLNEELRVKLKNWFFGDLMKCISRFDKNWKIVYIDTLKHEDALLQDLLDADDWESVRLEMCDDNLKSNVPEIVSDEEIRLEHDYHKKQGILDVFYREYRNLPVSKEDATFKEEYFQYYEEHELIDPKTGTRPFLLNVVLADPAKTVKMQSADSAVVGWGIDRASKRMYVRDIVRGKMYPDELYDAIFSMVLSLNAQILGVEVTSLEQFIVQPIKNEMRVRGLHPRFEPLKAQGKKEERVEKLSPFYRLGYVYHNPRVCGILETQLLSFPRSKHWDVMDAACYIVKLMEILEQYFDPVDFDDPFYDEFAELEAENEKALVQARLL